jgi:hypothetical protein
MSSITNLRIVYEALNLLAFPFQRATIPPLLFFRGQDLNIPSLPLAGENPSIFIG